jgi:hypothetical protein
MALSAVVVKVRERLLELTREADRLVTTASAAFGESGADREHWLVRDVEGSKAWKASAENAIRRVVGDDDVYSKPFREYAATGSRVYQIREAKGVLLGLIADIDGEHLVDIPMRVRAEVFSDLLEQADYLLSEGFERPAAVLIGCVLEDLLRKLCAKRGLPLPTKPKLDSMNAELARVEEYNKLVQKQITAWADIRNRAAHGEQGFTTADVQGMLAGVLSFAAEKMK